MSVSFEMTEDNFKQFLILQRLVKGEWQLPVIQQRDMDSGLLINARNEWYHKGWIEMDFDGEMHPLPPLGRVIYDMSKVTASLCFECEGEVRLFLKTPVKLIRICKKNDRYTIDQISFGELTKWIYEEAVPNKKGQLTVEIKNDEEIINKTVMLTAQLQRQVEDVNAKMGDLNETDALLVLPTDKILQMFFTSMQIESIV